MRFVALALFLFAGAARADFSEADLATAARLRDGALASPFAYQVVASLTTEVGSRMAGSPGDERAVAWAVANLKRLGFANVRAEPFAFSAWKRGPGHAGITAPNDTLDKVDPAALRVNVAAWAVIAWLAAQADADFGPLPREPGR